MAAAEAVQDDSMCKRTWQESGSILSNSQTRYMYYENDYFNSYMLRQIILNKLI